MTTFTGGKWIIDRSHKKDREGVTIWGGENGDDIIADVVEDQHNNHEANAALIVQAPALYNALDELTKHISLSKLDIRKDFSLILAHAFALKVLHKANNNQP